MNIIILFDYITSKCFNFFMQIILKKKDINEFNKVLDTKDINMSLADLFICFIEEYMSNPPKIKNLDDEKLIKEEILNNFLKTMEIDSTNSENKRIIDSFIVPGIKLLSSKIYEENPYLKNIKIPSKKFGNLSLKTLNYEPFELFIFDDIKVDENSYFKEISSIGFFKNSYRFPALFEKNIIWMSINPNEIETMKKSINEAFGKTLVYGLGLGYFEYMISLKKEVDSILIIEKNHQIIELFEKEILPQFEFKNKIETIETDAFEFSKKNDLNDFDFVFVDLWHNPLDGIKPYVYFKNIENKFPKVRFSYWLEEGLLAYLRRCLISLIDEEINGSQDSDYLKAESESDNLINSLHFLLKNTKINSFEDIKKLLSDDSLKSFAKNL